MTQPYVRVSDLKVAFPTEDGLVRAVDGVTFDVERGKTLAIVGESGSGKSVTSQAIMGLLNRKTAQISGEVWVGDTEMVSANDDVLRKMRGSDLAMIFQDPFASLHPFYRIGNQLVEAVRAHGNFSKSEAQDKARQMLTEVGIPNPERRLEDYPHQLSGGMRQRVMIAMALINGPSVLIADEPTTALDVTVQAQIMDLLGRLQEEYNTAVILITHDLGVVADVADEVAVMYAGRIVERGGLEDIFYRSQMPYTVGLLSSVPRLGTVADRLIPIPGQPPSVIRLPEGCRFEARCGAKAGVPGDTCQKVQPKLLPLADDPAHHVRCHLDEAARVEYSRLRLLEATATGEAS
jgi:peptide/nickel transport system ATP-binding protein